MNPTPSLTTDVIARIRSVLQAHGRLPGSVEALADDADLYRAGMSSHASVNVMLALEDEFDVEFPDEMLTREVFETITNIGAAIQELTEEHGG